MIIIPMSNEAAKSADTSSALTSREQKIMQLLLAGAVPKEIAGELKISHSTVLFHKKNLYSKLNVHSIQELFAKHGSMKNGANEVTQPAKEVKAVFIKWDTFEDELGSKITLTPKIEHIQGNYIETYTISGDLVNKFQVYAGAPFYPDPSTLKTMKNMSRFSFTVLGDGNSYEVAMPTIESIKAGFNHYVKVFTTENGIISEISFNIDELSQSLLFGKEAPFVRNNIEYFQINPYSRGEFNLKIWNIRFYL